MCLRPEIRALRVDPRRKIFRLGSPAREREELEEVGALAGALLGRPAVARGGLVERAVEPLARDLPAELLDLDGDVRSERRQPVVLEDLLLGLPDLPGELQLDRQLLDEARLQAAAREEQLARALPRPLLDLAAVLHGPG